jgi:hypothetical protein
MRAAALALAMVLGAASQARAQAQPVVHREGEYTGVVPGEATETKRPRRAVKKATLSWVGFSARDGGAEVFLQAPSAFTISQEVEGSALVVHLAGLTRQVTNTRRPIDTRFFDNPLARIVAQPARRGKKRGRGIEVRITFKNPKDARAAALRTATEADGFFYAYLTFPEGADGEGGAGAAGDGAGAADDSAADDGAADDGAASSDDR